MSASIHRYYMANPSQRDTVVDTNTGTRTNDGAALHPFYFALKNRLNYYGVRSDHYLITASTTSGELAGIKIIKLLI